jgi:hypothetical protein
MALAELDGAPMCAHCLMKALRRRKEPAVPTIQPLSLAEDMISRNPPPPDASEAKTGNAGA